MSFIAGSLEAYTLFQPYSVTLTIDGQSQRISPLVIAMANGAYFGGGMKIAPQASPTDGFLDVVIVDQVARSFFLRHFVEVYQGRHIHLPGVHVIRAQQITMTCENIMDVDIDGEDYQAKTLDCHVIPQKISMLKPSP